MKRIGINKGYRKIEAIDETIRIISSHKIQHRLDKHIMCNVYFEITDIIRKKVVI